MAQRIPLSQGAHAVVSDEDYARVSAHKWSLDKNGYAVRKVVVVAADKERRQRKILLHRFILAAPKGLDVDHVNGDPLDNRRDNIRLATRSQNMANSGPRANGRSPYKGVSWHKRDRRWCASIMVVGHKRHLGNFDSERAAALAYDRAAFAAWGEFSRLNFPDALPLTQLT